MSSRFTTLLVALLALACASSASESPNCTCTFVKYSLHFPHFSCSGGAGNEIARPEPINVTIPVLANNSYTLQMVMEAATDQDESYQFSSFYMGSETGYLLVGVNGTEEEGDCVWYLYYQAPGGSVPALQKNFESISRFEVEPESNIVLCYQNISPSPTGSTESSAVPSSQGVVMSPTPTPSPPDMTDPTDSTSEATEPTSSSMGSGSSTAITRPTLLSLLLAAFAMWAFINVYI